jgi:PAS domain S-box-containing protein
MRLLAMKTSKTTESKSKIPDIAPSVDPVDAFNSCDLFMSESGVAFKLLDPKTYRYLRSNQRARELTDYSESELLALNLRDLTHPDDWQHQLSGVNALLNGEQTACAIDKRLVKKSGRIIAVCQKLTLIRDSHGAPLYFLSILLQPHQELWGRRANPKLFGSNSSLGALARHEMLIEGLRVALKMICCNSQLTPVLDHIARLMESVSVDATFASILLLDDDKKTLHVAAAPRVPAAFTKEIEGAAIGPTAGSCGTAIYLKQPVITSDIERDERWKDYAVLALANGLRASWSIPLIDSENNVLGSCAMYYQNAQEPNPLDYDSIALLAQTASLAIQKLRCDEALIKAMTDLKRSPPSSNTKPVTPPLSAKHG